MGGRGDAVKIGAARFIIVRRIDVQPLSCLTEIPSHERIEISAREVAAMDEEKESMTIGQAWDCWKRLLKDQGPSRGAVLLLVALSFGLIGLGALGFQSARLGGLIVSGFGLGILCSVIVSSILAEGSYRRLKLAQAELERALLERSRELAEANRRSQREAMSRSLVASQLEVERQRLEAILQQMPAGVIIAEPQSGKALVCNQIAKDFLEPFKAKDEAPAEDPQLFADVLRSETPLKGHVIAYPHPKGGEGFIQVNATGIKNSQGQVVASVATFFDITENRRREAELRRAKAQAEEANRTKTAFLANCSHEIRTPLSAILGFVDLIRLGAISEAERNDYLDIITRNGQALAQIINDILDVAKIEAGHLQVTHARVALNDLVEEVAGLLRIKAREKGLELFVEKEARVPAFISSDPVRLKQILINLLGNAVKFTERGSVTLSLKLLPRGCLGFLVKDTGIGIPFAKQDRLFKVFSQVDDSSTRLYGGSGLGLVLSRRLAQALGGNVELLEAAPGEGCTFMASIPLGELTLGSVPPQNSQLSKIATPSREVLRAKGVRILVAEDSLDGQLLLRRILTRAGAHVDVVSNGLEAIERASHDEYDIVLMDLQMPTLDGYTATRTLRERGYAKPIVALTAHALKEERERSLAIGCSGHLTKPIDQDELFQTVARLAGRSPSESRDDSYDERHRNNGRERGL